MTAVTHRNRVRNQEIRLEITQAVCAIRPQSSMGAQFTNFARNVNSPSVMGKFSIYFILISSHFDYVLYYYIEKECLVLMCA